MYNGAKQTFYITSYKRNISSKEVMVFDSALFDMLMLALSMSKNEMHIIVKYLVPFMNFKTASMICLFVSRWYKVLQFVKRSKFTVGIV